MPPPDDLTQSLRAEAARLRALADQFEMRADAMDPAEPDCDLMRYYQAAKILNTSPEAIRKRVERGQLEKHVIAGRPFVSESAVRALASTASALSASCPKCPGAESENSDDD